MGVLSTQVKKDLDKFTKYLGLKATEIIVGSRLGQTMSIPSNPHAAATDWFNLNVNYIPEVLTEAKKVLDGDVVSSRLPLCVEISLCTPEHDYMFLEYWCLELLPAYCDSTPKIIHTVHKRIGILLKSLVSVTRVIPGYRVSRRQGSDSFGICYKIYMGTPVIESLGEKYKYIQIGQVGTPIGTLQLSVSFRTKMTISPTHPGRDSMMLKSDHFNTNLSPKSRKKNQNDEKTCCLSTPIKKGAFVNCEPKIFEPELIAPEPPFNKLFAKHFQYNKHCCGHEHSEDKRPEDRNSEDKRSVDKRPEDKSSKDNESENKDSKDKASEDKCSEDIQSEDTESLSGSKTIVDEEEVNGNLSSPSLENRLDIMMDSSNDDFIMKIPFRTPQECELGRFYRDCQRAPPLETFEEFAPLEENEVNEQLQSFESISAEYDSVLKTLCPLPDTEEEN